MCTQMTRSKGILSEFMCSDYYKIRTNTPKLKTTLKLITWFFFNLVAHIQSPRRNIFLGRCIIQGQGIKPELGSYRRKLAVAQLYWRHRNGA